MHTLLDLRGSIPSFIHVSDGKLHDVQRSISCSWRRERSTLWIGATSISHDFMCCIWPGSFFVTRAKLNLDAMDSISRATVRSTSVICDQITALNGFCTKQDYLEHLCRICVKDAESDKTQSDDLAGADHLRALEAAGRWKCSSSGSNSVFGSNSGAGACQSACLRKM